MFTLESTSLSTVQAGQVCQVLQDCCIFSMTVSLTAAKLIWTRGDKTLKALPKDQDQDHTGDGRIVAKSAITIQVVDVLI
jgi:hypothetical protein